MQEMGFEFEFELDRESKKKLDEFHREVEVEIQEVLKKASETVSKWGLCYVKELH